MKFMVVNGPNLNMFGIREKEVYGNTSYESICKYIQEEANKKDVEVTILQSNIEGELINFLQQAFFEQYDGIIINPGAYTHTSLALYDAIKSINKIPVVEVHMSNVHARESFRHESKTAPACIGQICGFKEYGYIMAIDALISLLDH